jgi:hypothetical protein
MRWNPCSQPIQRKNSGRSPYRSTTTASPWKGKSMTHTQPCSREPEWVSSGKRSSKKTQSLSSRGPGCLLILPIGFRLPLFYGRFVEKVERPKRNADRPTLAYIASLRRALDSRRGESRLGLRACTSVPSHVQHGSLHATSTAYESRSFRLLSFHVVSIRWSHLPRRSR